MEWGDVSTIGIRMGLRLAAMLGTLTQLAPNFVG